MKQCILIWIFFFQISLMSSQDYKEVYSAQVEEIEVLVIDMWVHSDGTVSEPAIVPEWTTVKDLGLIESVMGGLQNGSVGDGSGERVRTKYMINFINPKYEHQRLSVIVCEKLAYLREGKFEYANPLFKDMMVERKGGEQSESYGKEVIKAKIEWISNCEYTLSYPESTDGLGNLKKSDIIHVEIIGELENNTIVYRSVLNGQVITGMMRKL